jgi:hypothetical protein
MADQDAIQSKRSVNIRRSERVFLRVPILVRGQAENDSSLSEESHTLVVNAHGALIVLAMKVRPGQGLLLRNKVSGEGQECRVIHVGDQHASKNELAIAFTQPAPHFWHIDFPPADWKQLPDEGRFSPRSAHRSIFPRPSGSPARSW